MESNNSIYQKIHEAADTARHEEAKSKLPEEVYKRVDNVLFTISIDHEWKRKVKRDFGEFLDALLPILFSMCLPTSKRYLDALKLPEADLLRFLQYAVELHFGRTSGVSWSRHALHLYVKTHLLGDDDTLPKAKEKIREDMGDISIIEQSTSTTPTKPPTKAQKAKAAKEHAAKGKAKRQVETVLALQMPETVSRTYRTVEEIKELCTYALAAGWTEQDFARAVWLPVRSVEKLESILANYPIHDTHWYAVCAYVIPTPSEE